VIHCNCYCIEVINPVDNPIPRLRSLKRVTIFLCYDFVLYYGGETELAYIFLCTYFKTIMLISV
jgi:hypothetical protein